MKRVLVLLVTLIGLAVARPAYAKPSIAILGLEVIEESDTPDPKAAAFAEALTEALRQRARLGTGPFTLAAGSDKNLIEMKLLSGCDSEANACMAGIGGELAADRLLYGRIQKNGANYQISLKLLNVDTKSIERTTSDLAPLNESSNAQLAALGKKLYAKITGMAAQATLIVKANVAIGTVYLDGEVKGSLVGGVARIEGLAAGDYKLMVDADCYLSHEAKISIEGGRDVTEPVELEKNAIGDCGGGGGGGGGGGDPDDRRIISGGESRDGRPGGAARAMFWTSGAIALVGGGVWGYGRYKMSEFAQDCPEGQDKNSGIQACKDGFAQEKFTYVGGSIAIVGALAAGYFLYRGYIAAPKANERPINARAPRRHILVAPTVSTTTIGGVMHIEF